MKSIIKKLLLIALAFGLTTNGSARVVARPSLSYGQKWALAFVAACGVVAWYAKYKENVARKRLQRLAKAQEQKRRETENKYVHDLWEKPNSRIILPGVNSEVLVPDEFYKNILDTMLKTRKVKSSLGKDNALKVQVKFNQQGGCAGVGLYYVLEQNHHKTIVFQLLLIDNCNESNLEEMMNTVLKREEKKGIQAYTITTDVQPLVSNSPHKNILKKYFNTNYDERHGQPYYLTVVQPN